MNFVKQGPSPLDLVIRLCFEIFDVKMTDTNTNGGMRMKKMLVVLLICSSVLFGYIEREWLLNFVGQTTEYDDYTTMAKQDLLSLWMAYPEDIEGIEKDHKENIYVVMKSGKRIIYDDKRKKTINEKLADADLQDMMEQIYPLGDIYELMDIDNDPGRIREYDFFKEVYGKSKEKVQANLTTVRVGYKNQWFNNRNDAAQKLDSVMKKIIPLGDQRYDIRKFIYPLGGTFNYRYISGTGQLSPHAFGIAIDLAKDDRDYWQWTTREAGEKRLKEYPREIISTFEQNYFIWGGKWGHFDILHFEYRPELIIKSQYFSKPVDRKESWYKGVPLEDSILQYIRVIDSKIL